MTRRTRTFADVTDADVIAADRRRPRPDARRRRRRARRTRCSRSSTRATSRSCASARARSTPSCGSTARTLQRQARTRAATAAASRFGYGNELREFTRARRPRRPAHERDRRRGWDVAGKQALAEQADDAARQRASSADGDSGASVLRTALGRAQGDRRRTPCRSTGAEARARAEALFRAPRAALRARPRHRADRRRAARRRDASSSTGSGRCSPASTTSPTVTHLFDDARRAAHRVHGRAPGPGAAMMTRLARVLDAASPTAGALVRRLPGARHRHQGPGRPGPRARSTLPWAPDAGGRRYEAWARLATLMGGNNRGTLVRPRRRRRGAGRVRGRRPAPPVRARRAVERHATRRPSRWTARAQRQEGASARATA